MADEKVLFEKAYKNQLSKDLEKLDLIKCAPGEKVLCVERRHPIVLVMQLVLPIVGAVIIFLGLVSIFSFPSVLSSFNPAIPIIIYYLIFTILSVLLVIEIFNFMTWYYQFYIITNKALLHKHFFTIGGFYSEAVFLEEIHEQEIIRQPPNIICDFLKIQDVYVYFHKLEREEPFVFKTPNDAQKIEDLVQDLAIEHGITARVK